jgi:hypothetical protein
MALSKHVAPNRLRSCYLYYNLIVSHRENTTSPPPGDMLSSFVGLIPGNFHKYSDPPIAEWRIKMLPHKILRLSKSKEFKFTNYNIEKKENNIFLNIFLTSQYDSSQFTRRPSQLMS